MEGDPGDLIGRASERAAILAALDASATVRPQSS